MENLEHLTLGKVLENSAAESPDKVAIVDGDRRTTYADLNDTVDALAVGLAELGIKKGDRVAIYMKNALELVTAFYALQKIGVVVVWINALYRAQEAEFILKNSAARGLFIFDQWDGYDYLAEILKLKPNLPELEHIIVAGNIPEAAVSDYSHLIDSSRCKPLPDVAIDPQKDLCMLLYTSGTTGRPKGAMIRHYAAVRAGQEYAQGTGASADDIFIGILPMSHSYGCGSVLVQPILLQATLVLMDKFDVEGAFELIESEKITLQMGAPPHYILELNHKSRPNYDLSSLRAGLIAGMIAPEGLITRVEKELESLISDHPKVEQVAVVATPNPVLGESICACVIPAPGETLALKDIREFVQNKVAPHKLPDELCIMEDFPKLSGGVKLKKFGKGGLAELAAHDENRERIRK